jgi:hypothetical protein
MMDDEFTIDTLYLPAGMGFSKNVRKAYDDIDHGDLRNARIMADRIKDGGATESQTEIELVYEALVTAMDQVLDLTHMVRRREQFMANNGFDPSKYGEISLLTATSPAPAE